MRERRRQTKSKVGEERAAGLGLGRCSRGDTFLSIINGSPAPVTWMSESVNEVDGVRRSDRGDAFIGGVEVEVKEVKEDGNGKVEKGGKKASCRGGGEGRKKYNDTIIKYKRWNTYYGDYDSFPYI